MCRSQTVFTGQPRWALPALLSRAYKRTRARSRAQASRKALKNEHTDHRIKRLRKHSKQRVEIRLSPAQNSLGHEPLLNSENGVPKVPIGISSRNLYLSHSGRVKSNLNSDALAPNIRSQYRGLPHAGRRRRKRQRTQRAHGTVAAAVREERDGRLAWWRDAHKFSGEAWRTSPRTAV